MRKDRDAARGAVHTITIDSEVLASNMLGDPTRRDVHVYTPAGWKQGDALPLLVDLVGFTGSGFSHTNWKNFGENVPERVDRLVAAGDMPPVVIAFPDCFTRVGGNQYINSLAVGRWEDFLIDEMLPAVETQFGCGGPGRRGVFGKSSGGFGAMTHGMRRADVWSAAACHSGDMGWELLFFPYFPPLLRELATHELSIEKLMTAYESADKLKTEQVHNLMTLAMAAEYDPDPDAFLGLRLPVDLETCELIEDRWANWLAWDPNRVVDKYAENLASLKALYIDCGDIDQYNLVYGARVMHRDLDRLGIDHIYEEFPDNHSSVDYRMDRSLPVLANALTKS